MATAMRRCELCFATSHTEKECAQGGDPDQGVTDRLKAIKSAVQPWRGEGMGELTNANGSRQSTEACQVWNSTGCTNPRCKYSHLCSVPSSNVVHSSVGVGDPRKYLFILCSISET